MDAKNREQLEKLSKSKRIVGVFIQWRYLFYTNLEDFHKPNDAILIGLFGKQNESKIKEECAQHFDFIEYFEWENKGLGVDDYFADSRSLDILPNLEKIISEVVRICDDIRKIRLIDKEEFIMHYVGDLREKFGIPGPRNPELAHIRNKTLMKVKAEEANIPTAKFLTVDFLTETNTEVLAERITSKITAFPIFAKPEHGVACGGSAKIANREELVHWITENLNKNATYLVEEFIKGREFWASIVLQPNGVAKTSFVTHFDPDYALHKVLTAGTGRPMTFYTDSGFEKNRNLRFAQLPNVEQFLHRVIDVFKPPFPHFFCIQGYQLEENKDSYILTELAYRINGARGTAVSYRNTGVSNETALLMCHLDPSYIAKPDPNYTPVHSISLWYPKFPGTLQNLDFNPGMQMLSKCELDWLGQEGEKMSTAKSLADFIIAIHLSHTDKSVVTREAHFLRDNWLPNVV